MDAAVAPARSGLKRVAGLSASLVGTQAITSILGLAFWTLATRTFTATDVGVAGAAVAMMMLLSSLGSLGLGTLLIARLPVTAQGDRRVLVRTSLLAAGSTTGVLAIAIPMVAVHVFGAENLRPLVANPLTALAFAAGTAIMAIVMVLDQAVLTIGIGVLQFERNVLASVIKIGALAALNAAGVNGGMTIFVAWAVGSLVSLPLISLRTRGGWHLQTDRRLANPQALKGLGRMAASHHALNITLQAALQILPIMVTALLSARENAFFNSAILVTGFVFALPYAIAISLFASASGSEREVLSRIRLTLPFSLAVSVLANIAMFPLAGFILSVFGRSYANEGVDILRALVLAGIPFVIKDHFIALRRVQGRTTEVVWLFGGFLVLELAAAAVGAELGGTLGLTLAWVGVLAVEAIALSVPLYRSWRRYRHEVRADGDALATAAAPDALLPDSLLPNSLLPNSLLPDTLLPNSLLPNSLLPDTLLPDSLLPETSLTEKLLFSAYSDRRDTEPEVIEVGPAKAGRATRRKTISATTVLLRRLIGPANLAGPAMVLMSLGVLLMAVAANAGRAGSIAGWTRAAWIGGLVLIFLPACFRIVMRATSHVERMILAVAMPMILQFSRLVLNPTQFAFHDELIHANTLRQIDETSRLFTENPLLPVSGYYPGLEVATDAIHRLTGLSAFVSSVVTLMLARVIISLAIIAIVGLVTGSRRAGAVGAVVYVLNPQQLFFNSQYSYQTLALPLAILAVYLFAVRRRRSRSALVLPILATAMVTFTHHLTAILLVGAFAVWLLVDLVVARHRPAAIEDAGAAPSTRAGRRREQVRSSDRGGLLWMSISGAAISLVGALNPGSPVRTYLESIIFSSTSDVTSLTEGKQTKALFSDAAGSGPARWEQGLLLTAVLLGGLAMVIVLRFLWTHRRSPRSLLLIVGLLALLYPVIPGGHLTRATAEVGDRASGFVFIGLAAVLGWWLWRSTWRMRSLLAVVAAAVVMFLGNIILGAGPTAGQLPGPYEISADARSIDADNLAAAAWLATGVPADSVVYGDRTSGLLAAADGGQYTVLHVSTNIDASRLLLDPQYTDKDVALIRRAKLDYLIVDIRLSTGLPHQEYYIESGEFGANDRTGPVPAAALNKFASVPGVQRIYDNGSLVIYDVRGLR
ncbi:O-antigen/teichoic acid export membrane protein [Nakamurella sp. UYEF19]|uniref:lipopolysaccharide biosynthesis protein n=1 Tax=Nakamurella sp. UYEF19 TaxID=1756392 RepID=UPI0033949A28